MVTLGWGAKSANTREQPTNGLRWPGERDDIWNPAEKITIYIGCTRSIESTFTHHVRHVSRNGERGSVVLFFFASVGICAVLLKMRARTTQPMKCKARENPFARTQKHSSALTREWISNQMKRKETTKKHPLKQKLRYRIKEAANK